MNQALRAILAAGLPERRVELVHQAVGILRWRQDLVNGESKLVCEIRSLALPSPTPMRLEYHPISENEEITRTIMSILEEKLIHDANKRIGGKI